MFKQLNCVHNAQQTCQTGSCDASGIVLLRSNARFLVHVLDLTCGIIHYATSGREGCLGVQRLHQKVTTLCCASTLPCKAKELRTRNKGCRFKHYHKSVIQRIEDIRQGGGERGDDTQCCVTRNLHMNPGCLLLNDSFSMTPPLQPPSHLSLIHI